MNCGILQFFCSITVSITVSEFGNPERFHKVPPSTAHMRVLLDRGIVVNIYKARGIVVNIHKVSVVNI